MSAYTDILPDLSQGYCVIDTETTGLDRNQDRIIEVCVVVHREGQNTARTALLRTVGEVPDFITEITGITTDLLHREGYMPTVLLPTMFAMRDLHTLPIVGHNIVGFDREFLLNEARRIDLDCFANAAEALNPDRIIDTGALYKGIKLGYTPFANESHYEWACRILDLQASGLYWNLAAAAVGCGVPFASKGPHRARSDALTCQRIFAAILDGESKRE